MQHRASGGRDLHVLVAIRIHTLVPARVVPRYLLVHAMHIVPGG